jgi:hypothetical protein
MLTEGCVLGGMVSPPLSITVKTRTLGKNNKALTNIEELRKKENELRAFAKELKERQVARIEDNSFKTRLSILHYGIVGNTSMFSKQNLELLEIFAPSFGKVEEKIRQQS